VKRPAPRPRRCLPAFVLLALASLISTGARADAINGTWVMLTPEGTPPSSRYHFAAIYDPIRERLIVDGGAPFECLETWALSLSGATSWARLYESSHRSLHSAIYDAPRDRMLLHAWQDCQDPGIDNYVLTLDLAGAAGWSVVGTSGTLPASRLRHTMVYDPLRDRMLIFGGQLGGTGSFTNEVWELSLSGTPTWSPLVVSGTPPAPRRYHTAIYDPVRDVMLVFGGWTTGTVFMNDVWQLTLGPTPAWSLVAAAGTPPGARYGHSAIYDSERDRMVVFGGASPGVLNEAWALSLGGTPTWSALAPAGTAPLARYAHRAVYDAPRDRMVVFGGYSSSYLNDVWTLDWSAAADVDPPTPGLALRAGPSPARGDVAVEISLPRAGAASVRVYDIHGRLVRTLFDGGSATGERLTWNRATDRGDRVAAGIYLVRLSFAGSQLTRRLVLAD